MFAAPNTITMKLLRFTKCVSYSCLSPGWSCVHPIPVVVWSPLPTSSSQIPTLSVCFIHCHFRFRLSTRTQCAPHPCDGHVFFCAATNCHGTWPFLLLFESLGLMAWWWPFGRAGGGRREEPAMTCIWFRAMDRPIKATKAAEYCHELAASWCTCLGHWAKT